MEKCRVCGNPVHESATKCSFCGARIPPRNEPPSIFKAGFDNIRIPESSSQTTRIGNRLSEEEKRQLADLLERSSSPFSNQLLLGVKMFLAEVRSWRKDYVENRYVCSDFAREVVNAATGRRIRCGYVILDFQGVDTSHAIVAFDTDYGIRYFEPQSGDEQEVVIGKPYPVFLQGVPSDAMVSNIYIQWNDNPT